mgnify:FL=1
MRATLLCGLLLAAAGPSAVAQEGQSHPVRLVHGGGEEFRFDPRRIEAAPGDVVEFVVESGGPYVIGFEGSNLDVQDRDLLNQALPDRTGLLRGPVLSRPGSSFRFTVPPVSHRSYRLISFTHLAYRMEAELVVR